MLFVPRTGNDPVTSRLWLWRSANWAISAIFKRKCLQKKEHHDLLSLYVVGPVLTDFHHISRTNCHRSSFLSRKCTLWSRRKSLVGMPGLEPRISEPKSDVLPLHHIPKFLTPKGKYFVWNLWRFYFIASKLKELYWNLAFLSGRFVCHLDSQHSSIPEGPDQ